MNFKEKELIIFDFDGTLINSIPDITIAVNEMLTHYNYQSLTVEKVTPFVGNGAKILVERALVYANNDQKVSDKYLDEAFAIYFAAYKKVSCKLTFMYPNVLETLEYLHYKKYKMAICTNKPFEFIEPILDKLSIKKFFVSWIGENSLPKKKPDPSPLFYLAETIGISVEKCIMVGDSKNDILAAQNAFIESIGVSYGYNYNENIADYNPTIVLDDFITLKELF